MSRGLPFSIRFAPGEREVLDQARTVVGGFFGPIELGPFVRWAALQHAQRLVGGEAPPSAAVQAGLPLQGTPAAAAPRNDTATSPAPARSSPRSRSRPRRRSSSRKGARRG